MDFGLLTSAYRPCFEPQPFLQCSQHWSCQLPRCNSFTSHSSFIVFWERDITSEHHENPVHITIIDHIRYLLSAFTYYCSNIYHYYHLRLILCKRQGRRD